MNVIPPLTITDAMVTSSSVVEVAPAAYAGGSTYALNDTVSVAGTAGLQAVYRSLQAGNIGHTPASSPTWWVSIGNTYQAYSGATTYALADRAQSNTTHLIYESLAGGNVGNALTDTTKWIEVGQTNTRAMFDLLRSTASTAPTQITVVLTPGVRTNSVALLGLVGDSATITATSGGSPVYSYTEDLTTRASAGWYAYYFGGFKYRTAFAVFDIPPYSNIVITITVTAATGDVSIGACVLGMYEFIGDVQYDAVSDVLNFSGVTRDFAGSVNTMVQRRNVPRTVQNIYLDKALVNSVRYLRDALNATPAVWAGIEDHGDGYFESLLIVGFYKKFSINLSFPTKAVISLELEEI